MSDKKLTENIFIDDPKIYDKKINVLEPKDKKNDIDLDHSFYDNIIEAGLSSKLDLSGINSLSQTAQSRNEMYNIYDTMCEDGRISAVIETYADDSTQRNDSGNIVWCESSDSNIAQLVNFILDSFNINKNIYKWVYSLCKYGDVYLRLYRESEYSDKLFSKKKNKLNEDIKIKAYKPNDKFAIFMEMVPNPAEMFELTRFGKTIGYIKADVNSIVGKTDSLEFSTYKYKFKEQDITIYEPTEFVHAALETGSNRQEETVDIFLDETDYNNNNTDLSYSVRKGESLLADVFQTWRSLQLLEASVLLNRITKSSIVRLVNVNVGDMPKENVTKVLRHVKQMIEQKSAINTGVSLNEYTNPGPIENNVYVPVHGEIGAISISQLGGDVDVKGLADLDYYINKLYGDLRVPKQYFCLRGNTPIRLLNGKTRTIEYLFNHKDEFIGKGILSCSPSGKIEPTKIKNIILTKQRASFIRIHLNNEKYVDLTPEHRVMLRDGSFVEAQALKENDSLMPCYDKMIDNRRYILDNEYGKWKPQYRIVAESIYSIDDLKGKQVHHIDHNKHNDDLYNLIPLTGEEHINCHINELHEANKEACKKNKELGISHGNVNKFSVTNGINNKWLNKGSEIPDGYWLGQTCQYSEEGRKKISETISKANKGRPSPVKGKTKYNCERIRKAIEHSSKTRAEREKLGMYSEMHKKHSEFCKKSNFWVKMHEGYMKTISENRLSKEHYVRCLNCGSIHKIMCNQDWYNEYLNMNKLWYCCKECQSIDGRGKLARSYNLYLSCDKNIDKYASERCSGKYGRRDAYFLPESLKERLPIIDNYCPDCNHKVTKIEWLDVEEPAYDIEVESENHTFELPCGIFVHNCQTDDSTGFNGGTSLTIISSRYSKKIIHIQNTILQAITDAVNLILLDKGLLSYINNFTLKMLPPITQEEIDRRESLSNKVQLTSDIMNMLSDVEDPIIKSKMLKSLLSSVLEDSEVIELLQEQIDLMEQNKEDEELNQDLGEESDENVEDEDSFSPRGGNSRSEFNDTFGGELNSGGEEPEPETTAGAEESETQGVLPSPNELNVDLDTGEEI